MQRVKQLGVTLACVVAVSAVGLARQAPPPDAMRALVASYLSIQTALASDKVEDVKAPARTLVTQAVALGKDGADIAKAATAMEKAGDIAAARDALGPLSDAVIARVRAGGSTDAIADLRLGYCPMVKRSWIQRGEQVRNPYYGASMLTCGELKPVK
jgi:hypothetical protein